MNEKNFYIFAGVNGAGKTSLYELFSIFNEKSNFGEKINTDEIVNKIGDWKNTTDQMKASRLAIKMRKDFMEKGVSFNQETTLTGNTILKSIKEAKKNGYKIKMIYVGVENPKIAKERVKRRVLKGGHDIPPEIIEKRYYESLRNIEKIALFCDTLLVYDNSKDEESHIKCFVKDKNSISVFVKKLPKWANDLKYNIEKQLAKENQCDPWDSRISLDNSIER